MLRLIGWLLALPFTLAVVAFAVANRQSLTFDLWPLPWSVSIPAYGAVLGPLLLGLGLGLTLAWLSSLGARRRAAIQSRRADSLQRQLTAATQAAQSSPTP